MPRISPESEFTQGITINGIRGIQKITGETIILMQRIIHDRIYMMAHIIYIKRNLIEENDLENAEGAVGYQTPIYEKKSVNKLNKNIDDCFAFTGFIILLAVSEMLKFSGKLSQACAGFFITLCPTAHKQTSPCTISCFFNYSTSIIDQVSVAPPGPK